MTRKNDDVEWNNPNLNNSNTQSQSQSQSQSQQLNRLPALVVTKDSELPPPSYEEVKANDISARK
jgi:hypothetical protein